MMKFLPCAIAFLLINFHSQFLFSQENRNSGFIKPMNLPFNLAGSFGEPRKDHFHSGIDIKTNGVEGELIYSIGDGYISRIRVSPYGYGRAIYITHANGYTSVYGHLSRFYGEIKKYIHEQHYAQQKSELDIYLDANKFPVKQNDMIAFSGNTGGSSAPHLHFEIRDSKTEHALNPLDFYPRSFYVDTIPPQINKVKVSISQDNFLHSLSKQYEIRNINNIYTTDEPIPIYNNSEFYFSLQGFDKQDTSENKNGIKKIEVFHKDSLVFKYDLTEIDFKKTRMCNAFVDYNEMMNDNGYFYNCYKLPNNQLSFYSNGNGFYTINKNDSMQLSISCIDYLNNTKNINLNFVRTNENFDTIYNSRNASNGSDAIYESNKTIDSNIMKNKSFTIKFSKGSFYSDNISCLTTYSYDKFTTISPVNDVIIIDNIFFPLHKPASIEINSSIKKDRNKIVVVRQDSKGKETALKTTSDKTKFYAETKQLGTFYLKYDTTNPTIEIRNYKLGIKDFVNNIEVKIKDNLSGINTYNGYIDEKWVNFYYDAKNDLIQYNIDQYCTKGEHTLKVIVTDNVGNKTIVQQKFIY